MTAYHINRESPQCKEGTLSLSLSLSLSVALLSLATITTGGLLASSHVSADNPSVVDEINITVPVSCTISGTGMNSHNADINNGLYEDEYRFYYSTCFL